MTNITNRNVLFSAAATDCVDGHVEHTNDSARSPFRKKALAVAAATMLSASLAGHAQAQDDRLSGSASFNSDAFFGVNPFVGLTYDNGNDLDVTFYGIFWGAGTGQDWGNWTEFGVGVGFDMLDGDLYVNPQLGFTSGNLLSSGTADDGIVGDGYVPNITMNYGTDDWEGQLYFGWYLPLREEDDDGETTLEYIHYWVNGGKKFGKYFSAGVHFEELELTGGSNVSSQDGYQWLGPYFQVANDKFSLRFSAGTDLTDDDDSFSATDFYKLQFGYNF
jgi:hypothetical protein